jgi:hypothetical protein
MLGTSIISSTMSSSRYSIIDLRPLALGSDTIVSSLFAALGSLN